MKTLMLAHLHKKMRLDKEAQRAYNVTHSKGFKFQSSFKNQNQDLKRYQNFIKKQLKKKQKNTICEQLKNPLSFNSLHPKVRLK